jgi:hypothetical protein
MKKTIFSFGIAVVLLSCNDNSGSASEDTKTNAAANDTTQSPNGITTGSAISTNPDATRLDTSQQDSTQPK